MGNNINISGIDFNKLPEDFNIESAKDVLGEISAEKLNKTLENFNIKDGLNRDEAAQIIVAINTDEENPDEITNEEIRAFCEANADDLNGIYDIETRIKDIVLNVVEASKDALGINKDGDEVATPDADEPAQEIGDEKESEANDEAASFKATVQKWGSAAEDGNKYANDCLDHIMRNYYQNITPYTQEWFDKETEIMNANQHIYGDENGNGARAAVGGTGRHSAVLYADDEITLPGLENKENMQVEEQSDTTIAGQNDSAQESWTEGTTDEDGVRVDTYTDDEGNIAGKKQYKDDTLMWESSIEPGENNTTVETKTWLESGKTEKITYNKDNNPIEINTLYADKISSSTNPSTGDITYYAGETEIGKGKVIYGEDGSWSESIEYTEGENKGIKVDTTFDKFGVTTSKTITNENGTGSSTEYQDGSPIKTVFFKADGSIEGTKEYKINNDGSHTETVTSSDKTKTAVINYDAEGNEVSRVENENNTNGKQLSQEEYQGEVLTKKSEWLYDKINGDLLQKIETNYQDNGETAKSITVTGYDPLTGGSNGTCTVKFDENGNPVEISGNKNILPQDLQDAINNMQPTDNTNNQGNSDLQNEDSSNTQSQEVGETETKETDEITKMRTDIATARAQALHAAMDGAGTDENTVKNIINNITGQDLVDVINIYKEMFDETLEDDIKGDFSWISGESDLLRKLDKAQSEVDTMNAMIATNPDLKTPERTAINKDMVLDAQLLAFKAATTNRDFQTDERVLFDMFREMSDSEINNFIKYCKENNVDVVQTIKDETSLETEKSLLQMINKAQNNKDNPHTQTDKDIPTGQRTEDEIRADIATARAQVLHAAMDRLGTDEDAVKEIIDNITGQDLVDVINEYERLFGETLEDDIKGDFSWISGESDLLRKLDKAQSEVDTMNAMIATNPDLKTPERTAVTEEQLREIQLMAFKEATTKRDGTDEKVVYQMLQNGYMTNDDIKALNEALKKEGTNLHTIINSEFGTQFSPEVRKELIRIIERLGIKNETTGTQTAQ